MFHIQRLDTYSIALGASASIDLQQLWKRRNGQFCRLAGINLRVANQVDQAASGGSIIPGEALSTVLSSVSLSSNYEPYGMLLPPVSGSILHNLIARYLIAGGAALPCPADIAAADGDTAFTIDIPVWFRDFEYARPEDFSLVPQGLVGDSIEVTAAATTEAAAFSTGAAFENAVVITPYAYFETSDEAQIPMVRRWKKTTRTTDKISLGRGRFTHLFGLTDLHIWDPDTAANGLDTINTITIQRGGQWINIPVDPIMVGNFFARSSGLNLGSQNGVASGVYDVAATEYLPILTPVGAVGAKLTDTMDASSPLVLEFGEDSLGGCSKLISGELVELSDERATRMSSELYGIAAPSVATKRLRPGNSDATLATSKKLVLPRSARAL
jgi:hypothetical protein